MTAQGGKPSKAGAIGRLPSRFGLRVLGLPGQASIETVYSISHVNAICRWA
jgi:hypothetical protein